MKTTHSRHFGVLVGTITVLGSLAACQPARDALTAHSQTAAEAAGYRLTAGDVAELMAGAEYIPVDSLTPALATSIAQLWADYVRLSVVYQESDSTRSLDFTPLLEKLHYFDQMAVFRFRDSVLSGPGPSEEEVRRFFEARQPYTRLDVRRISLSLSPKASETVRDSVYALARRVQQLASGGGDFVELAREWSAEPLEARGQLLAFQGHEDFAPEADSVVFRLQPGEVSPVIPTPDAMLIYRVERRRVPDFESARDRAALILAEEQQDARTRRLTDSLFESARLTVMRGAVERARAVAEDPLSVDLRRSRSEKLVQYDGGEVTTEELRDVLLLRPDLAELIVEADDDEDVELYLGELARDEVLIAAAERAGHAVDPAERDSLSVLMADQLSRLGERFSIYHLLVTSPLWDMQTESIGFVARVLEGQRPTPMLGYGYRQILDASYSERIDPRGVEAATRQARRLRESTAEMTGEAEAATDAAGDEDRPADAPGNGERATGGERPADGDRPTDGGRPVDEGGRTEEP